MVGERRQGMGACETTEGAMSGRSKKRKIGPVPDKTFSEGHAMPFSGGSVWRNSWASAWGYRDGSDGSTDADADAVDDDDDEGASEQVSEREEVSARNVMELIGLLFGTGGAIMEQAALARASALFTFFDDGTCASSSVQCLSRRQISDTGTTLGMAAKTIALSFCKPGGMIENLLTGSLNYDMATYGAHLGSKFGKGSWCPKSRKLVGCRLLDRTHCADV